MRDACHKDKGFEKNGVTNSIGISPAEYLASSAIYMTSVLNISILSEHVYLV